MSENTKNRYYINNLIERELQRSKGSTLFLDDESFVSIMRQVQGNIELVLEMNLINDFKQDILSSINQNDKVLKGCNLIINSENVKLFTANSNTIEIIDFFNSYSLCIVVEPNYNMFIDIDYSNILKLMDKKVSRPAFLGLELHRTIQLFAFVDKDSNLLLDDINSLKEKVLIDCDFQKNEVLFPYFCEALDAIDLSVAVYTVR